MSMAALGRRRRRGANVLARATAAWKASHYSGTGALLDLTGRGHNLQLGSTAGADSNDPLWLPFTGTAHVYLPGTSGNFASAADSAALSITGDIDIRVRVAPVDWTPGTSHDLIAKWASSHQSYLFRLQTTGVLTLYTSLDGTAQRTDSSTVATGFTDGAVKWVRVTRASASGAVAFYTSDDGSAWTQLGATLAGTAGAIFDGTAELRVFGSNLIGAAEWTNGNGYRAQIYNGINGTLAFDADFTDLSRYAAGYGSLTEKSANAATVTLNRSASGRKLAVVDRPLFLLGVDDFFETPDHANLNFGAADSFTVVVACRTYSVAAGQRVILSKKSDLSLTTVGYILYHNGTGVTLMTGDGTNRPNMTEQTVSVGVAHAVAGRRIAGSALAAFIDGVSNDGTAVDTSGNLANGLGIRLGVMAAGTTNPNDFEFIGAALFRSALSDGEIDRAGRELLSP